MPRPPPATGLDRDRRVQALFAQVVELDPAGRSAFLHQACGRDRELRDEVEALLDLIPRANTQRLFPSLPDTTLWPVDPETPGDSVSLPELRPGDRVGRYRVLAWVGAGGMGAVYAAYDTALERKIALKLLRARSRSPRAVDLLLAEASAMARLAHPNVVTVHDVGVVGGHLFVAMEYVTGMTLGTWRRAQPRSVREIMTVMAAVASALAAAHAAGVVHCDVKPSNILVDGARVWITDFGLSVRDGVSRSRSGGTPGYMAPEQIRGEPRTPATDVFSFCATLFEMLYLQPPFGTGTLAQISARMEAGPPLATRRDVRVPRRVKRLLQTGLAADAHLRPASMAAIAASLQSHPGRFARRSLLLGVAITMIVAAIWLRDRPSHQDDGAASSPRVPQALSGPAWVRPPQAIPATMFGVTIQTGTGAMPAFQVGAVRFWDSGTTWTSIEPRRGEFEWATADRLVTAASTAKLPVLFTLGGTPPWAAPTGVRSVYEDGSRDSPPDRMADWAAFVGALASRYGDRIEAYEIWVLGNDARFYAGSVETLVEMTRIAYQTIKAAAPNARIACPGMGRLWTTEAQQFLRRFAKLGGYQHCDVASIKLYQRTPTDPPEDMLQLVTLVDRMLHEAGVHPPLWNTGTTYEIPLQGSLDETMAVNHAVRFFLVGLYAQVRRMYFYNWGGTKIPIVLQPVGGSPTAAALAIQQLQRWLEHASIRSCGRGRAIGLPDNVWQCEFTITGGRTFDAAIRWTHLGRHATAAPPNVARVYQLDGTSRAVAPGEILVATEQPVFIEYKSAPRPGT